MKKYLLILSALLLTAVGASAQTYTGNLYVSVEGSESNTPGSQVTVAWDEVNTTLLDFTLQDFAINISGLELDLGNITVKDVNVVEGTNEATISCSDDHEVELGTTVSLLVSDVAVEMTGTISEDKLSAEMTISVQLATLLGGSTYEITATFRSYSDDELNGSYMLQNVETGYYLGSGCTWGTQASLIKQPQQFTLTETDGTYTLESYVYNGANSNKLGTNLYVDCAEAASWTIEKQSNGAYTLYNATVGYLAGNGKDAPVEGVTSITSATYWNLITKDDIVESQASATSASPVDVTGLINNPSLNKNSQTTYGTAYWSTTGTVNIGYTNAGGDTKSYGNVAEGYHVGFSMYQTLSNLTPGIYVLSAQGFHRDDDSQASYTAPVMYVGSELTSGIPSMTSANGVCTQKGSSGQTMADAQQDFLSNLYPITPIQFTVEEGNTSVEFGFKGTDTHEWVIWGDLELLYYGETLEYTIGEPECSVKSVTPGSEVSITFSNCITPNETETPVLANGKSITVNGSAVTATLTYSGTIATVTFTVPATVARGTTVTVIVPQGLVEWSGQSVSSPTADVTITLTTPLIEDQKGVYLFNLGENEFLSRGHNYNDENGTAADVDVYGLPVDITANADGKYNIRYIDSNMYMGGVYWATANEELASAASFTIVAEDGTTDDGKTIYRFRNGSSNSSITGDLYVNNGTSHGPLGLNDDDNGIKSTADRQWVIYSKDERDALKAANVLAAKLATATALDSSFSGTTETAFNEFIGNLKNEVYTSKVSGASLSTDTDLGYWTAEYVTKDTETGDTSGSGFTAGNNVIETYEDVDDLTQTITGLEEGIYKVTLQGFNRMGAASYILANLKDYDISLATLGANDDEINLKTWASDREQMSSETSYSDTYPNTTGEAAACFTAGLYNNELYTYVSNGSLTITIACPDFLGADWVIFTNLTLTRYYTDDIYTNDVTWKLANPSFEVDNVVENLTPDANTGGTSRCDDDKDGAWTITSLTGWNLTKNSVCDLMSEKAAATDNDFGAPGKPADGTYMLYLRDAWASVTDKVSQSVTLPAGNYKLTVDSKCVSTASGHSVQLTVGDIASADLTISSTMPSEWNTTSVKFYLAEETTLDVAVSVTYGGSSASGLSVLLDNFKLYSAEEIEKTISWEMTSAGWGTMILPFDYDLSDENNTNGKLTAYTIESVTADSDEDDGIAATLTLSEAEEAIKANTPYIMGGDAGEYTFTGTPTNEKEIYTSDADGVSLTGTLVALAVAKGAAFATDGTQYLLQHHDGVDDSAAFYPIVADGSEEATLDAYHCYLTYGAGASPTRLVIGFAGTDGEATAIVAVEGAEAEGNGAIYDLSGRKVSKAVKGVYIQNGKKVLVK